MGNRIHPRPGKPFCGYCHAEDDGPCSDKHQDWFAKGQVQGHDPVNHPSHYTTGGVEVIKAIEAWQLNYHRGNAVKYIARAGRKGGPECELEDLKKAAWYLNREIMRLSGESA